MRGAEGTLNGSSNDTNTTFGDDDWTASMGLAIGLSIPLGICLIPCALITLVMVRIELHDGSSNSPGYGMIILLEMCCCFGILGLVALVFGLVSIVPTRPNHPGVWRRHRRNARALRGRPLFWEMPFGSDALHFPWRQR